ncbi:MAG: hypothetical protein GQ527_12470 [Bacteroidales bacterium]|nr:hypothetical protein [Bacteroidales bacterium]
MSDRAFVYLIVSIIVAHFIFGVAYLFWKIYKAPKSDENDLQNERETDESDSR